MDDNVVQVVFKAITDQFHAALNGLYGELSILGDSFMRLARGDIEGFARSMATAYGPVGALYGGLAMVAGAGVDLAKNYAETGIEIGKFADALGISAEQASPLYEMASDLEIPLSALQMAAKKLAREGLPLTVESLADLAEEFQTLEDPADRVAFLTDYFGRSGQQLGTVLEMSTGKLRDYHTELGAGQMFTEQEISDAWALHENLDRLGDIWEDLKLQIGGVAAVPLAGWLQGVNDGWAKLKEIGSLEQYFAALGEYLKGIFGPIIEGLTGKLRALRDAFFAAANSSTYGGAETPTGRGGYGGRGGNAPGTTEMRETLDSVNRSLNNLPFAIRDTLTP